MFMWFWTIFSLGAPDTSKGRNEEEERKGRDTAMEAVLVFILATFWLWFDGRGLFGGNHVFKNPAGYIFIADEKPTMMKRHKSTACWFRLHTIPEFSLTFKASQTTRWNHPSSWAEALLSGTIFVAALNCLPVSSHANRGKGSTARDVICTLI